MRRILFSLVIGSAVVVTGVGTSCKGSGGAGGTDQVNPLVADVVFEGGATDEAAVSLLQATLVNDPTSAANFTSPANMAVVSATSTPTFSWMTSSPSGANDAPAKNVRVVLTEPPTTAEALTRETLAVVFSGIRSAYAHGTPTSGPAYFLNFSTTANAKLLRVFTTNTSYTPDATAFGKLKGANDVIHAVITNASFDQNRIAQSGGPWKGTEITFTVK